MAATAATFKGLIGECAYIGRGAGERVQESTVDDFHQANWLPEEAEREITMDPTARQLLKVQIDHAIHRDAGGR